MIKIERLSNNVIVKDGEGLPVIRNQLFTLSDFNNITVEGGEIMYSINELELKHKAERGFEGTLAKEEAERTGITIGVPEASKETDERVIAAEANWAAAIEGQEGYSSEEVTEDAKVEDAKVEDAKVEAAKVEDAKVEDAKAEDAKVEDAKVAVAKVKSKVVAPAKKA